MVFYRCLVFAALRNVAKKSNLMAFLQRLETSTPIYFANGLEIPLLRNFVAQNTDYKHFAEHCFEQIFEKLYTFYK
jgi:hypothetical protein